MSHGIFFERGLLEDYEVRKMILTDAIKGKFIMDAREYPWGKSCSTGGETATASILPSV